MWEEREKKFKSVHSRTLGHFCSQNMECTPRLFFFKHRPQLLMLFGKVVKPLGGGALQEEGVTGLSLVLFYSPA